MMFPCFCAAAHLFMLLCYLRIYTPSSPFVSPQYVLYTTESYLSTEVLSYFTNLHDSITKHSDGDVVTTRHGTMSTYCPTNALLVFYVFLCTINLHTVSMQTNLCSRVVRSISAPQHHIWRDTESENGERAEWLLSAVTWLQPRVEKFVKPILESGSADELDEKQAEAVMTSAVEIISNHCRQLGESLSKPEVKQNLPSKQYRKQRHLLEIYSMREFSDLSPPSPRIVVLPNLRTTWMHSGVRATVLREKT
ncbi:hypothetical protein BC628DRAFT_794631 [Trametes gibbosa]|nr:hypothetical protein BC628DRAFT_794631 [Trametes gibbosa]